MKHVFLLLLRLFLEIGWEILSGWENLRRSVQRSFCQCRSFFVVFRHFDPFIHEPRVFVIISQLKKIKHMFFFSFFGFSWRNVEKFSVVENIYQGVLEMYACLGMFNNFKAFDPVHILRPSIVIMDFNCFNASFSFAVWAENATGFGGFSKFC